MAVDAQGVPAGSFDARALIRIVCKRHRTIDGDVVIIPENDELVQLEMAGQRDCFLADAFHQAAVSGNDIGMVVYQIVAEMRIHDALG